MVSLGRVDLNFCDVVDSGNHADKKVLDMGVWVDIGCLCQGALLYGRKVGR